ncbi:MAG: hypothetical protein HN855_16975 [Anaerolineae bacterium]|nr:hypothetical protein [Anaerolineae bacterium]MBT7070483.1 hypothetical protein [Anaerolineae bacterium]MBT7326843.1 hypothetical protein [Anaerolineae bacterium]
MKTKNVPTILVCALLLSACVGVTPYPAPPTISATSTIPPTITETTRPNANQYANINTNSPLVHTNTRNT